MLKNVYYYFRLLKYLSYFPTQTARTGCCTQCTVFAPHSVVTYLFTHQLILILVTSNWWFGVLQHTCARSKMLGYVLDISAFEKLPSTSLTLSSTRGWSWYSKGNCCLLRFYCVGREYGLPVTCFCDCGMWKVWQEETVRPERQHSALLAKTISGSHPPQYARVKTAGSLTPVSPNSSSYYITKNLATLI